MTWKKANDFYQDRKEEASNRIRTEQLFQDFRDFLEWRTNEQAM